ncbi:MAG: YitT family protein [Bacteroidales bacterium]
MNPVWRQIVIQTVLRKKQFSESGKSFSSRDLAKGFRELRIMIIRWIKDVVIIAIGIGSAAFGLESFLLPNKFIDGGATGISLLFSEISAIPLPVLIILVNIPFLVLGFNVISRSFAVKAAVTIVGLAIVLAAVSFPEVTHDKLLVSVFGGFFLGAGIGLSVRGGSVLDGTEVLAIFISRKLGTTVGDIIIVLNIFIFTAAAVFLSIETALYSMLTYLSASKTLDFIIEGIEEYTGVTIISPHSAEIRKMIIEKLGGGVTVYKGERGFGEHGHANNIDILYTVLTRLEINKLKTEIEKIDPHSFIVMNRIKDTKGGMIKKRRLKH